MYDSLTFFMQTSTSTLWPILLALLSAGIGRLLLFSYKFICITSKYSTEEYYWRTKGRSTILCQVIQQSRVLEFQSRYNDSRCTIHLCICAFKQYSSEIGFIFDLLETIISTMVLHFYFLSEQDTKAIVKPRRGVKLFGFKRSLYWL